MERASAPLLSLTGQTPSASPWPAAVQSAPVSTASTPGIAAACAVSMCVTAAWGVRAADEGGVGDGVVQGDILDIAAAA